MGEGILDDEGAFAKEKIPNDVELVVEAGCGGRSVLELASDEYLLRFKSNSKLRYDALDIIPFDVSDAEQGFMRSVGTKLDAEERARISFKVEDATDLPYEDNSVTQIIFKDVFGDTRIDLRDHAAMVLEAKRVLRPGGTLKIIEQTTPSNVIRLGFLDHAARVFGSHAETDGESPNTPPHEKSWDRNVTASRSGETLIARITKPITAP